VNLRGPIGVLIAEDSELLQELLVVSMAPLKEVAVLGQAMTGRETIAAVREKQPDVLLLDLHMPDGGGLQVLEALAADARRPRVVVMTFECDPLVRRRCRSLGAEMFFDKGEDPQVLVELLLKLAAEKCASVEIHPSAAPLETSKGTTS
jgi:DNA-binding NarL/FixJ family response regulator